MQSNLVIARQTYHFQAPLPWQMRFPPLINENRPPPVIQELYNIDGYYYERRGRAPMPIVLPTEDNQPILSVSSASDIDVSYASTPATSPEPAQHRSTSPEVESEVDANADDDDELDRPVFEDALEDAPEAPVVLEEIAAVEQGAAAAAVPRRRRTEMDQLNDDFYSAANDPPLRPRR